MKILQETGVPIYQQIANQLRDDILAGKLKEEEFLPSIRGLAKELKISVITTMKAYEMLEDEGLISAVPGKGFVVKPQNHDLIREAHRKQVEDSLAQAIASSKLAEMSLDEMVKLLEFLYQS